MNRSETGGAREQARAIEGARAIALWLDRALIGWLFALVIFAPHSIAATQISWMICLLLWVARLTVRPRPRPVFYRTPIDYAMLAFFALTFISSLASYDRDVSLGKMRAASLFTIIYLIAQNVRSRRVARALAVMLVASCMINVIYTMAERAVGRGVKIENLAAASPLHAAGVEDGDTLLEVNGHKLHDPEELVEALKRPVGTNVAEPAHLKIYRFEATPVLDVPRGLLLNGDTALGKLGIGSWSRGRDWRAKGFYGHYVTYAEVVQLIASLALGLLIALPHKATWSGALLTVAVVGLCGALLLTVTRAPALGFLLSAFVMVLAGMRRRRTLLIAFVCALLLVPVGLFVLQQQRNVGFYDPADPSTAYRETVYREGLNLLLSKPRHMLVGIGMDSIKRHWREWGMFENGKIPVGHMHSTPLQLALERGIPALIAWFVLVGVYAFMLWRLSRSDRLGGREKWIERGVALGALGGLAGFMTSGMVHYNLGDSEVAMVLYIIMGLSLVVERQEAQRPTSN
jgi:hypothetical protein